MKGVQFDLKGFPLLKREKMIYLSHLERPLKASKKIAQKYLFF